MPTRSGVMVAIASLASCALGRALGVLELYVLGSVGLLTVALGIAVVRRRPPHLEIERRVVPTRVTVGSAARVELTITNGARRSPPITLVDPVSGTVGARMALGPLPPGGRQVTGYRLPTSRRGVIELGPLLPEIGDPFAMARRTLDPGGALRVIVLPAIELIPATTVGGSGRAEDARAGRRTSTQTPNDDLVSLRPYVVGDDLRRVHWPSSARTDDLLVRRDEHDHPGRSTVILDARRRSLDPADFERAVSAAASLIHAAEVAGDHLRLVTTDGFDSSMVDVRRNAATLLEHLAVVDQHDASDTDVARRHRDGATPVVLTGADAEVDHLVDEAAWSDPIVVRFLAEGGVPPSTTAVLVGADERFGAVWSGWSSHHPPPRTGPR